MIKKLITILAMFAIAIVGMLGFVGDARAQAYDDVTFTANTAIGDGTTHHDLEVQSGGKIVTFAVGASDVTVTLLEASATEYSDITFKSASGKVMSVDCSTGATYTPGATNSTMRVKYDSACPEVVLTIGSGTLTDPNVAASPLTAATPSVHVVSFRTVNTLIAGQKIKLVFGTGYTITDAITDIAKVTTFTDDGINIKGTGTAAITLATDSSARTITITLGSTAPTIVAKSEINIVLDSSLVTNPTVARFGNTAGAPDLTVLGIDFYTTTSGDVTIDSLADQTPFDRIVELTTGWNIFAPSQELESSGDKTTVITPIASAVSDIYTLKWHVASNTMTWQTPTTIDPLYGYAIKIDGSATQKLPLDFAKETGTNGLEQRIFANNGWHLIGYMGTSDSVVAQVVSTGNCVEGLTNTGAGGKAAFSSIEDLTGKAIGSAQTSHAIVSATKNEIAGGLNGTTPQMEFTKDYGYAIAISAASTNLTLTGRRGL